jgi:hypothetical protein
MNATVPAMSPQFSLAPPPLQGRIGKKYTVSQHRPLHSLSGRSKNELNLYAPTKALNVPKIQRWSSCRTFVLRIHVSARHDPTALHGGSAGGSHGYFQAVRVAQVHIELASAVDIHLYDTFTLGGTKGSTAGWANAMKGKGKESIGTAEEGHESCG